MTCDVGRKYRKLFQQLAQKKYRETHHEQVREARRAWRKANPEKAREAKRAWRAAHCDEIREAKRAWRKANPDKVRAATRRRRKAHPERVREAKRLWRIRNADGDRATTRRRKLRSMREQHDPTVHGCEERGVARCNVRTPTIARGRRRCCSRKCSARSKDRRWIRKPCTHCGSEWKHKPTCARRRS